jgi:para-aminobenzoate synthetase
MVPEKKQTPVIFRLSRSEKTYLHDIEKCLQEIHEGETYQVCLTNQIHTDATPDPLTFYRTLRQINPAPYSAFLRFGDVAIACSSPRAISTHRSPRLGRNKADQRDVATRKNTRGRFYPA